jgi:hypothetical protein
LGWFRTFYEAPAWGDLSVEEIEAMRERVPVTCPDIPPDGKIRSMEGDLVIEIPCMATDKQVARLQQWLLDEGALRAGSTITTAERGE